MTPDFCQLYQQKPKYTLAWDNDEGPGQKNFRVVRLRSPPAQGPVLSLAELSEAAERLADETGDPTILDKIGHYGMALARYAASGFKTRSKEEVARIYTEHCQPCEHRDQEADACRICGCNVRTEGMALIKKLAMGSERCPKGKW